MTQSVITQNGMYLDFDQIVNYIEVTMTMKDKKKIAKTQFTDLGVYHHNLGTWIRNAFGLWRDNPLTEQWRTNPASHIIDNSSGCPIDNSPDHPDAISMRVIEELWTRVQHLNKP